MFTEDQKIWILTEGVKLISPVKIKREFIKKYNITPNDSMKLQGHQFTRVISTFKVTGTVKKGNSTGRKKSAITEENVTVLTNHMEKNRTDSIRSVSRKLDFSKSSTQRMLKNNFNMKPYKFHRAQELNMHHQIQRSQFCDWFLRNKVDPQKVICSDEKWFTLSPRPNHQNSRYWSTTNPHLYEDGYKQGGEKVMCWVGIVNGEILPIHWFEEDGRPVSVNGDRYLTLLENIWTFVGSKARRNGFWFQQDGAPSHCTNRALEFLHDKFGNRVISRRSEL